MLGGTSASPHYTCQTFRMCRRHLRGICGVENPQADSITSLSAQDSKPGEVPRTGNADAAELWHVYRGRLGRDHAA